jgi:hypothetical protein
VIIVNFVVEIVYASYMLFAVVTPAGHSGPLFEAAKTLAPDLMHTRRLYAIEAWIAITGLAVYLAITEIGPRLAKMRGAASPSSR